MDSFGIFILLIAGVLPLYLFGYLIGVKRYMRVIAGYKPGRIVDEASFAKRIGVSCFLGGTTFLLIAIYLIAEGSMDGLSLVAVMMVGGLVPLSGAIYGLSKNRRQT